MIRFHISVSNKLQSWLTQFRTQFQLIERDGRVSKLRRRDPQYKKLIKSDLVYLDESPDYCDRDDE